MEFTAKTGLSFDKLDSLSNEVYVKFYPPTIPQVLELYMKKANYLTNNLERILESTGETKKEILSKK